jgi:hypothetical protein
VVIIVNCICGPGAIARYQLRRSGPLVDLFAAALVLQVA